MKKGFTTDPKLSDRTLVIIGLALSALCLLAGAAMALTFATLIGILF